MQRSFIQDWQQHDQSGENVLQIVSSYYIILLTEDLMLFDILFVNAFLRQDFVIRCFVRTFATESVSSLSSLSQKTMPGNSEIQNISEWGN